jgi:hypothetical protein
MSGIAGILLPRPEVLTNYHAAEARWLNDQVTDLGISVSAEKFSDISILEFVRIIIL